MSMRRYFLDANILISGLLWAGNERKVLLLGEQKKLILLTSAYVMKELEDVLKDFGFDEEKIAESLVYLHSFIDLIGVSKEELEKYWDVLDDKDDIPVLAAAIKSKAILITGDKELLEKGNKYITVKNTKDIVGTLDS